MRIWGQCPKCQGWFDCEAWFDRSAPTPCCPTCALGPASIRYQGPEGPRFQRQDTLSELWVG